MRIAYLINYDLDQNKNLGVIYKIKAQVQEWIKLGHTVYFVSSKSLKIYDSEYKIIKEYPILKNKFKGRLQTALNLFYNYYYLSKLFDKIDIDLIYMRYQLYMPFLTKVLKKYKTIMEINGDDLLELKINSKLTHYYNKYTREKILRNIDSFVSVSYELKNRFLYLNKPITVIANGIDTSNYTLTTSNNKIPTFIFIGSPNQPWQGIDKVIDIANYFKEYKFYIIGFNGIDTTNIKYFGYISNKEAIQIIEKCDIGIGTLSLYKKGLNEASPLKTRQYLACGLPIIYAYKDTDLQNNLPFTLELKNNENNINYDKIEEFTKKVFNNKRKEEIFSYAKDILNYSVKEKKRLKFFKERLNEK